MKLPPSNPPPEKSAGYDKDRSLTRRTVPGAAGGMQGVDYEDDRRPEPGTGGRSTSGGADQEAAFKSANAPSPGGSTSSAGEVLPRDASRLVLEEDDAAAPKRRPPAKRRFDRDRLTVDKDAPERQKKRPRLNEDDDEVEDEEEQVFEAGLDLIEARGPAVSRAHLFDPEGVPVPGDCSITDPSEILRHYQTPVAYAKHCMILAEAFRRTTGATRAEAIAYLSRLFVALEDRAFGRRALKEFGPASGILDLYPLEIVEHVLDTYPGFLLKVGFGRFFLRNDQETLETDTATPLLLEYPEELKVRGLALKGGGRPGYVFEPADLPGRYRLSIGAPGTFTFLVSCLTRTGYTLLDRLKVRVRPRPGDAAAPDDSEAYPARDAAKVARWPNPRVPTLDPLAALELDGKREVPASVLALPPEAERGRFNAKAEIDLEVVESDAPIAAILSEDPTPEAQAPLSPAPAQTAGAFERPSANRKTLERVPLAPARRSEPPPPPRAEPANPELIARARAEVSQRGCDPVVAPPSLFGRGPIPVSAQAPSSEPDTAPIRIMPKQGPVPASEIEAPTEDRTAPIPVTDPPHAEPPEEDETLTELQD